MRHIFNFAIMTLSFAAMCGCTNVGSKTTTTANEEKETLPRIYKEFGDAFRRLDSWSAYMITSYEDAQRYFGRKADKNRKIYNGMIRTYFYQFSGPRPPRQKK